MRVVLLLSRVGPGLRGACSPEDVSDQDSCVTRTINLILRITLSSKCGQPGWGSGNRLETIKSMSESECLTSQAVLFIPWCLLNRSLRRQAGSSGYNLCLC